MGTEPLLAGIDVGTTNIKAVLFTPAGQTVAEASVPTPTHYPRPTWAYYDPEEVWQATVQVLRQVTCQVTSPRQIVSVAATSMGEAATPLDAEGRPTYEAIAWFDQRTQAQVDWLAQQIGRDHLFELTGLSLQPIFGLCKLLWLKENQPEAFARTVRWLNMADYIAYRLSGVQATDYSLASRTLALDLHRLQWADALLAEVGLSPSLFAPLVLSGTRLGIVTPQAAEATGLPPTAWVAAGGHDHVCGALAVGVVEPGAMLNSMGTAEAVFVPLKQPLMDPEMGRQGYTQGAHVVAGHYYVFGGQYTSGASVEWWREILGATVDYGQLTLEAEAAPPGSLGVCFLPHLRLASPPYDDPKGRGAFVGLNGDAKRGVLFRAILEGLAYESRHGLETLLTYPGVAALERIYAIGGNTRNALLMQIKASVYNQPITVVEATEATCLGAAVLGGLGAGVYADVPAMLAQLHQGRQTLIEPVAGQVELYEAYFRQVYQQLYLALRPLHHALYELQQKM
jgi:xylulokinase